MAIAQHATDHDLLTVAEYSSLLRVNQETVRRWIRDGSLPAVKVGRQWRLGCDLPTLRTSQRGPRPVTERLR